MAPDGWRRARVGDVARVTSGGTPAVGRADYYGGDIPFLKIDDITQNRRLRIAKAKTSITQLALQETSAKLYPRDAVLLTMYGTIGAVAVLDRPMAANQAIGVLLDLNGVLPDFMAYRLSHDAEALRGKAGHTTQSNISGQILKAHEVLLPPLAEQRKIAAILSSVDETIEKTEAVIAQLDVVKKAMLEELLTRGVQGRRLEPIAEEWRLGRVLPGITMKPNGWQLVRLTDVAKLESGHTPSRRHPEYWDGGLPWVSLHDTGALDGPEISETAQTVSDLGIANSSARLLPRGTVVFSRTATVGKATVLGREMSTSQDFANYVCGPRVHSRYLMHLLRFMQTEWARLMAGSTHQTIYMPVFRDLQVLLPEIREQERIAEVADAAEARIQAERDSLVPMRAVKTSLASELLSGTKRVRPEGAA
jgi:type I restriction enzyme S subunit